MKSPVHLLTWEGMGDNIYLRPAVRVLAQRHELFIETPWPEIYQDLPLRFLEPRPFYRTQRKNLQRQHRQWAEKPKPCQLVRPRISLRPSIPASLAHTLRIPSDALDLDLPDYGPSPITADRPVAVIRPATVRTEWANPARNPDPVYLAEAAALLRARGYCVVSVADVSGREEWFHGEPPEADLQFHHGELNFPELASLVRSAAVVVGGVGFLLPLALATSTPAVIIAGGNGGHNDPARVLAPWWDTSLLRWLFPDEYCRCTRMDHACPKTITDFPRQFSAALDALTPEHAAL